MKQFMVVEEEVLLNYYVVEGENADDAQARQKAGEGALIEARRISVHFDETYEILD